MTNAFTFRFFYASSRHSREGSRTSLHGVSESKKLASQIVFYILMMMMIMMTSRGASYAVVGHPGRSHAFGRWRCILLLTIASYWAEWFLMTTVWTFEMIKPLLFYTRSFRIRIFPADSSFPSVKVSKSAFLCYGRVKLLSSRCLCWHKE